MMRRLLLLAGLLWGSPVFAASSAGIDIQHFQPVPGGNNFFTIHSGEVNRHLKLSFGASLNYGGKLLQVRAVSPGGAAPQDVGGIVKHRIQLDAFAALGLFNWLEVGVVFPAVWQAGLDADNLLQAGVDVGATKLRAISQGDLRLIPKVRLVYAADGLFSLAIVPEVVLPTAVGAPYTGEGGINAIPMLVLSSRFRHMRIGLNLGYRYRMKPATIATITLGNEYVFKGAVGLDLSFGGPVPVELVGEVFGATQASHPFGQNTHGAEAQFQKTGTPIEGDLGVRISVGNFIMMAGGGAGLAPGYGAPVPRVFLSMMYYTGGTAAPDGDGDGVPDDIDKCPDKPEDKDGFQDDDGCPDIDDDKDAVLDEDDQCPLEPEDKDGFQDEDGCPDLDNDNDGVADAADKCPLDPEDRDGFADEDGCPDPDNDADGILDLLDSCPNEPEDMDKFQDEDGCPDLDNDHDDLPDLNDLCPNFAEDKDGVMDDDGCPEDNDKDGIADDKDKCPNEPETYNGIKDEDGCPDGAEKKSLVTVTEERIEIKESVFFKPNSAIIQPRSFDMLNQVSAVLRNAVAISKLRVEGHTDNQGPRRKNLKLSQDRAESVRQYLIRQGIGAARLEAVGFGPDKPVASNASAAGREKNRRVEFVIAEQKPAGTEASPTAAPAPQLVVPPASAPTEPGAPPPPPPVTEPMPFMDVTESPAAPAPKPTKHEKKKGKKGKKKGKAGEMKFDF